MLELGVFMFLIMMIKENCLLPQKKRCPFCNNKKWYDESLLDTDFILSNIKNDDILVLII